MRKGDSARGRAAHRLGQRAEMLAALWLRFKGYRILARRLKTRAGEIDLVARRGRALVIVEVKASARAEMAGERAVEALLPRQQQRLTRAADHLLAMRPALAGLDLRFDVVLVAPGRLPRHLEDAWRP
ncbi:MAG: YraN family protein [Parvibaculum sp.]